MRQNNKAPKIELLVIIDVVIFCFDTYLLYNYEKQSAYFWKNNHTPEECSICRNHL